MEGFKIVAEHGHYTVYHNGEFYCSADTYREAREEIENK